MSKKYNSSLYFYPKCVVFRQVLLKKARKLFQRYDLAERRAIDHKEDISLPNFFYRLDF